MRNDFDAGVGESQRGGGAGGNFRFEISERGEEGSSGDGRPRLIAVVVDAGGRRRAEQAPPLRPKG